MKRSFTRWKKYEAVEVIRRSRLILKSPSIDIRVAHCREENARILVVTPRKSGIAVQRNLFRRRWHALFYENRLNLKGLHWIVFAKPGMPHYSYGDLVEIFTKIVEQSLLI